MTDAELDTPFVAGQDTLRDTFIAAGQTSPRHVLTLLTMAGAQMRRNALQIKLDALVGKQAALVAGVNTERTAVQAAINKLTEDISAAASVE